MNCIFMLCEQGRRIWQIRDCLVSKNPHPIPLTDISVYSNIYEISVFLFSCSGFILEYF